MQYLYVGESNGGRVVRMGGHATSQIKTSGTENVLFDAETWDVVPLGPTGDCVFRVINVPLRVTNGYHIRVTPKVDGVALPAQEFSGSGAGIFTPQAWVAKRGARISARIQQLTRYDEFELLEPAAIYSPIRVHP